MKILHTGDWHLGKLVHGIHMTEDQRYLLKQLVELIKKENIDVLIIAGDVYDRSIPPTEAIELLDDVLSEIIMGLDVKVIMIAGNHDSADRLDFGSKILKDKGLYISGKLMDQVEPIVLEDDYGVVNFYPIPFSEPALVRGLYKDNTCKTHDLAIEKVMNSFKGTMDETQRNICISHAFVMGTETLETSDSERPLAIGGSEYVNVNHYEGFDYVALGHLHRPQKVKHDSIRYAGSLLKYSFSEAMQKKSVTIVDLKQKGDISIEQRRLEPIRDLRVIKGTLEDLMKEEVYSLRNQEDYICAVLTDRGKLFEPMKQLRAIYPNVLLLEKQRFINGNNEVDEMLIDIKTKKPEEQFASFYKHVLGEEIPDDEMEIFGRVFDAVEKEERDK